MANPFPGMDPYLETPPFWSDFGPSLLSELRNALLHRLLPRYDVRIDEYVLVMHEDIRLRRVKPDLTVAATSAWRPSSSESAAAADPAVAELEYPDIEPHTQRRLRIIHQADQRVVTVMELLSPANKALGEDGIEAYLQKRAELIASQVNLVEIDLLRGGERLPMRGPLPPGDYYVYIGRVGRKPRCEVMAWPLHMALPNVAIPLLPDDDEVVLDFAEVFRSAYEPALYDQRLPYHQPLRPAPNEAESVWIMDRLLEAQKI